MKLSTWQEQVLSRYEIYMAEGWGIEEFLNLNVPRTEDAEDKESAPRTGKRRGQGGQGGKENI